jgi:pimeloyl-ACP methyl ester carboxylesterase
LPKFCSKSATIASVQAGFVEAAGASVFVHRFGAEGPSVLYWHGGGGGSDELIRIAPVLEAAGYAVYGPDAPGYGKSPPVEPERYRASAVAELAVALIDELGIAPVVWVGYSWGGSIGFHVAARHPDRVRALALLDGGYLDPADDPSYEPSLDFEERIESWRVELEQQEDVDDAPIEVVAAAMAGSNVEPALPHLPQLAATGIPVFLAAATKPPEWNEIRARRIEGLLTAIPAAHVVRVESGHGILQEAGDEVLRALLDWLKRLG